MDCANISVKDDAHIVIRIGPSLCDFRELAFRSVPPLNEKNAVHGLVNCNSLNMLEKRSRLGTSQEILDRLKAGTLDVRVQ